MYNSSKYSKVLTIVLIIVIILIVGLLIFWGVDMFKKYNINEDADEGISAFKNQIQNSTNANNNNNIVQNGVSIIDPYGNKISTSEELNNTTGEGETGGATGESTTGSGMQYKGYDMVGYIEVPKTKIKYPVLAEATKKALETSVAILCGAGLNETGNTVISGHNYRNGLFFSDNAKLTEGDKIYITDGKGTTVTYSIYKKYITTPEDAEFVSIDTKGKKVVTLLTCTDDSKKRIVILAQED